MPPRRCNEALDPYIPKVHYVCGLEQSLLQEGTVEAKLYKRYDRNPTIEVRAARPAVLRELLSVAVFGWCILERVQVPAKQRHF